MEELPRIDADEAPISPFVAAFALSLTPELIRSGRSVAHLMARGFPRSTIELAIEAAERLVLEQENRRGEQ